MRCLHVFNNELLFDWKDTVAILSGCITNMQMEGWKKVYKDYSFMIHDLILVASRSTTNLYWEELHGHPLMYNYKVKAHDRIFGPSGHCLPKIWNASRQIQGPPPSSLWRWNYEQVLHRLAWCFHLYSTEQLWYESKRQKRSGCWIHTQVENVGEKDRRPNVAHIHIRN